MEILQGVLKQNLRPCAVVGYGVKIVLPSPPNYVTRSPGMCDRVFEAASSIRKVIVFTRVIFGFLLTWFQLLWPSRDDENSFLVLEEREGHQLPVIAKWEF